MPNLNIGAALSCVSPMARQECIWHFTTWKIHPFTFKGTVYRPPGYERVYFPLMLKCSAAAIFSHYSVFTYRPCNILSVPRYLGGIYRPCIISQVLRCSDVFNRC